MDILNLTGQNFCGIFNSKLRRGCIYNVIACITKWPNLKLKTQPEQLLGYLPLAFALTKSERVFNRGYSFYHGGVNDDGCVNG